MEILIPDIRLIVPELIIIGTAMVVLMVDVFVRQRLTSMILAIFGLILAFQYTRTLPFPVPATSFYDMVLVDKYAVFFKYIFYVSLGFTIFISAKYKAIETVPSGEYFSLLLLATSGMMLMVSSVDLVVIYLGLEVMALSLYVLAGINRQDLRANEAAMKYLLLGGFSSAILLYGIALVYGMTETTNLREIARALADTNLTENPILLLGLIFLIVAFAFKVALVPFHMWSPDVYEGAPTSVTAFMSVGPKAAGFAVMGRVLIEAFGRDATGSIELQASWLSVLWVLAIITMVFGNVVAIAQRNIKRMLAYSSIAHAGYILLGIIVATPQGLSSTMTYLMIYAFMNIGAFSIVIFLNREGMAGENLDDYKGLAKTHPFFAFLMLIFMFSLSGIPPTAGFMGKFYLFMETVRAGYTYLVIIALIFSAVSAYYYLRVVMYMYMEEPVTEIQGVASIPLYAVMACAAILVLLIGIYPTGLLDFAKAAVGI
ncbi:MAG TPA: NADH-quinone oxidoreductase subunit N [Thermodesulfovibrionia bacterium]|nr:NADH-quinone oxidoreductase subunit N [Thermodesulfovibrionia bacterium]